MISLFFKNCSRSFFWIREPVKKIHLFPELFEVLRKSLFCWKLCLDLTCFCVTTTRQDSLHFHGNEMNWILSFLGKSDQKVIGQNLLLSPANAVVKPAYSEFDHRPNPIQEECRSALGCITSRRHARLVEEHRFHQKEVSSAVRSLGSFPEGECDSGTGPKDAFDGRV